MTYLAKTAVLIKNTSICSRWNYWLYRTLSDLRQLALKMV